MSPIKLPSVIKLVISEHFIIVMLNKVFEALLITYGYT